MVPVLNSRNRFPSLLTRLKLTAPITPPSPEALRLPKLINDSIAHGIESTVMSGGGGRGGGGEDSKKKIFHVPDNGTYI